MKIEIITTEDYSSTALLDGRESGQHLDQLGIKYGAGERQERRRSVSMTKSPTCSFPKTTDAKG